MDSYVCDTPGMPSLIAGRSRAMAHLSPNSAGSSEQAIQVPAPSWAPSAPLSPSPQPSGDMTTRQTPARSVPSTPAFQVIPARTADLDRTEATLQAAMQSLALDTRRPVALEIASDGTGARSFLVRAKDGAALDHAKT